MIGVRRRLLIGNHFFCKLLQICVDGEDKKEVERGAESCMLSVQIIATVLGGQWLLVATG